MEALIPLLSRIENVALLVSVLGCAGLGYLHVIWRREERADRQKLLEIVTANTAAISELKNVLSASLGKAL